MTTNTNSPGGSPTTTTFLTVSRSIMRSWMPADFTVMVVATSWCNGRRLTRPTYPVANRPLVCDSGGFLAHRRYGGFPYSIDELADWALAWNADWCATPDYPCEPELADGEVHRRVELTVQKAAEAIQRRPEVRWWPVLQGWNLRDYLRCWELYEKAKIAPKAVGTLCRRNQAKQIAQIMAAIQAERPGFRYHLFGVKLSALKEAPIRQTAASIDTAAWSMAGEGDKDTDGGRYISAARARAHGYASRSQFEWQLARRYYARMQTLLNSPYQPQLI
jgi:hypothetical protein